MREKILKSIPITNKNILRSLKFAFIPIMILIFSFDIYAQSTNLMFKNLWYGFNTGNYPSSLFPTSGALADFDNDSDLDVVVSNFSITTGFTILFNNGHGLFLNPVQYPSPKPSKGIVVADFNNDGFKDLAVSNYGYLGQGNTISLLLNNGNGSFAQQLTFLSGNGPYELKAGYLNGDNFLDIVVANQNQKLNVFLNNGGNNFSNRIEYSVFSK